MSEEQRKQVLRLPKRHSRERAERPDPEVGARLFREQSLRGAIVAALVSIIAFGFIWAMLSTALEKVFPWMTVVQGLIVGLVVRRAGRGLDWRFPVVAAAAAVVGALAGNVVVAAAFTAAEFDTGILTVLRAATSFTWPVFFDEVITPADAVYALAAAGVAAFYANRRLTRDQYAAYRAWQDQGRGGP
ncbi:MAG: hypothetical protein GWP60_06925 [Gammaproteobacteria bacterium]|jgi:hypothetical protein|nr:hypothetical protein [Gammaproteobacteria bacterium]